MIPEKAGKTGIIPKDLMRSRILNWRNKWHNKKMLMHEIFMFSGNSISAFIMLGYCGWLQYATTQLLSCSEQFLAP